MLACKRCGKENQDHYKFCLGCGAELTAPPKEGGDVAMMKTMMADLGQVPSVPANPTPPGGVQQASAPANLPGMPPGPGPGTGPAPGMGGPGTPPGAPPPGPVGPPPGAPPPGMYGGPYGGTPAPAGPPPGVPTGGAAPHGAPPPLGPPPSAASQPAPSAPASGPRLCPTCQAEVPPSYRFCGACGTPLPPPSGPTRNTAEIAGQITPQPHATMTLIRPDGSEGGSFDLSEGENLIGRDHGEIFENDGYLSPTHAELIINAAGAVVRDLDSLNGVFVKMSDEEEILPGQILRIGQELLRFDTIEPPEPLEDGTEVMGSPNPGYWGKITVIIGAEVDGSAYPLFGDSVTLGRERGDINFPDDGYVSGLHARLFTRDGKVFLNDLGSSNGTFIKVQGERAVDHESFVLLGQQLFRLNLR